LAQVLYFIPALKVAVSQHVCLREFCLTCELAFIMHMLDLAEGATCQASNLLRALRQLREAVALGLVEGPDEIGAKQVGFRLLGF
jgi:PAB-dependent poly(A)-specific ribonuclease subunit 2